MSQQSKPHSAWNEEDRLKALDSYGILDTQKEEDFEDIVKMAAEVCNVPVSLISFVTTGRQWFKAALGFDRKETPLNMSICSHAILQDDFLVVPDTTKDDRTIENPLVSGDPKVRFYAGAVLKSAEGLPIGTVCVLDFKPRTLTTHEANTLKALARQVMTLLELRRALHAKSQNEEKLSAALEALSRVAAVVESSNDAIITTALDGAILSWNAGAERLFGYSSDEMIGESILMLIPEELQKEEPEIVARLKKGERIEHYETVRLGKGGRKIDISLTVSPVKDKDGKIVAASKIARDITDEKKRQETVRENETRFRAELEKQVNERTASLQEAVAQMEEFSYSVSHDLRAPLRAMQGYANALLEDYGGKIDEEGQDYLRHIVSAGNRMDRLTHDVLVYSKIPRTNFELHAVDLDRLVSDIVRQNLPEQVKSSNIAIEHPLLPVLGNESFLSQCVSNLIDNAVKFASKERALRVRVWTELHEGQVRLCFQDNGIGILPEHQSRVWGMFERVHPRDVYEGTGIGLAIVRKTVERMNGTMGLESDGVTGSKFWIQLPEPNKGIVSMKLNPNATILLVEDEPSDVFLMKRALKTAQITNPLQVANNGQEAINYLSGTGEFSDRTKHPIPSIIFLDLKLPYKNGFEVLDWIRTQEHMNQTLVMVLTSSSEERDIAQCYKLGARTFLVKPPNAAMLAELMVSLKDFWVRHNEFTLPDDGNLAS